MGWKNAVLQVLVYCPPFYRLFSELGKYLPGPVVGAQSESNSRATPLVDAIIQFLHEFDVKEKEPAAQDTGDVEALLWDVDRVPVSQQCESGMLALVTMLAFLLAASAGLYVYVLVCSIMCSLV